MMRLITLALIFGAFSQARAADIAIALTDDVVEVNASFSGAKVVLFGAMTGAQPAGADGGAQYDIVAVVRGPNSAFSIRPIIHEGVIWTAGSPVYLRGVPGAFLVHATRSLDEIAPRALRAAYRLEQTPEALDRRFAPSNAQAAHILQTRGAAAFARAFLASARQSGLYAEMKHSVSFKKGSLFSVEIDLPPKTPVGDYLVDVYLIARGEVISHDNARLSVNKVGLERNIYELAHKRPIAYGVVCVFLAMAAGWAAAEAFRKRG